MARAGAPHRGATPNQRRRRKASMLGGSAPVAHTAAYAGAQRRQADMLCAPVRWSGIPVPSRQKRKWLARQGPPVL